jgi:hypothetical protein
LFTCCPPGPLERENTSSISASCSFFIWSICFLIGNQIFDRTKAQATCEAPRTDNPRGAKSGIISDHKKK